MPHRCLRYDAPFLLVQFEFEVGASHFVVALQLVVAAAAEIAVSVLLGEIVRTERVCFGAIELLRNLAFVVYELPHCFLFATPAFPHLSAVLVDATN